MIASPDVTVVTLAVTETGTPVLELSLAGWVNATRPDGSGGQVFGTTDPGRRGARIEL